MNFEFPSTIIFTANIKKLSGICSYNVEKEYY